MIFISYPSAVVLRSSLHLSLRIPSIDGQLEQKPPPYMPSTSLGSTYPSMVRRETTTWVPLSEIGLSTASSPSSVHPPAPTPARTNP